MVYSNLTAALRESIIVDFCRVLKDQYVYPDLGAVIANSLKQKLQNGGYDSFDKSELFAVKLTEDVQEAGRDLHMKIVFKAPEAGQGASARERLGLVLTYEQALQKNFGFGSLHIDIESVDGKSIATLPISLFMTFHPDYCKDGDKIKQGICDILSSIADCDAILIDLRANRGGDPETVAFIMSFFLGDGSDRVHLLDMLDRNAVVKDSFYTNPPKEFPAGTRRYGVAKPVWVLTSKLTVSGGEDMTINFKAFGRAVIVGQDKTTAGAANPITEIRHLCTEHFGDCWTALVPNLRPAHAVTGMGWEGVGIESDIVAGEGVWEHVLDAEDIARRLAVEKLLEE